LHSNTQDQESSGWFDGIPFLVASQVLLSVIISLVLYFFFGLADGWGVVLGAMLVAVNMVLMQYVFRRKDVNQRDIYMSAAVRYVLFIVILLLFVWLGLNLLAVLGGMVIAYLVTYFFSAYTLLKHR